MKICITKDFIITCDRTLQECIECEHAGSHNTVERLDDVDLMCIAYRMLDYDYELASVVEGLNMLNNRSELVESTKERLADLISRLNNYRSAFFSSASTICYNLFIDYVTEHPEVVTDRKCP